ncbi:MAG: hypothetical protein DLM57_04465 [Pseudonocardiales bacterium]|nr:MAG: hypothetical protein DLM57_04465 [Pseudonocardiales bacterium]
MTVTDEQIRDSLRASRERMVLNHQDETSVQLIRQRAATTPTRRVRPRWALPAGIATGVLGLGASVAVAVTVTNDGSTDAFRHLHPNKADATVTSEQPHALLGNLALAGGGEIRAYVTTLPGRAACVLVEQLTPAGAQIDSIAYCGDESARRADLRLLNGAMIGWVPDRIVSSVRVSGPGYDSTARVVAQHFVVPAAASGSTETVTGRDTAGRPVSVWSVPVQ